MKKTKIIVDRLEKNTAVVSVDADAFDIPKKILPEDAKEGDIVYITITNDEEEKKTKTELAKQLLNETLKEE